MNKIILITGATDGIGKLAALKLASEGHTIYLHGRNPQKVEQVVQEAQRTSPNPDIHGLVADFSDLEAVKRMADEVLQSVAHIDVLINNAGVYHSPQACNAAGFDMRFVVNYFAPYVLTEKLLPLLLKSQEPRLLNLSSAAQAPVSLKALEAHPPISAQAAYAQSKLALTMWSFYLAKQHPEVAVLAVNPGSLLNTNMVKEAFGRFWAPADKGAQILYDLAILDQYRGVTGKYFDNDAGDFGYAHADVDDPEKIAALIQKTKEIIG